MILIKNTFGSIYRESVWMALYIWTRLQLITSSLIIIVLLKTFMYSCGYIFYILSSVWWKRNHLSVRSHPPGCLYILLHSFYSPSSQALQGSIKGVFRQMWGVWLPLHKAFTHKTTRRLFFATFTYSGDWLNSRAMPPISAMTPCWFFKAPMASLWSH